MAAALPGNLTSVSQSQGSVAVDGNLPAGGMDELLPLVMQLTNPDQVNTCRVFAVVQLLVLFHLYPDVRFLAFYCREKLFYWNFRKRERHLLT